MKSNFPSQNASNRAYKGIREMIFRYELIPGQKVTYGQLAAKLGMSKTPIINALNRLEQEEFVISSPNRGFFIKEIDIDESKNLFRIREALEILAVEECIRNRNPEGLKEIERALNAHRNYSLTEFVTRKRYALDSIFHSKIAECGGNKNLSRLMKQIWEQIYLRHRIEGIPFRRFQQTPREHQELFDAIKEGNLVKAKRVMKKHMSKAKEVLFKAIQKNKEPYELPDLIE